MISEKIAAFLPGYIKAVLKWPYFAPPLSWFRLTMYILSGQVRKVPVDLLTTIGAFSYSQNGWHPHTAVLRELDKNPVDFISEDSILRDFYTRYTPSVESGFLPVHDDPGWSSTKECYRPPWGGGREVTFSDWFEHWVGPKSDEAIKYNFELLEGLRAKIQSEGYLPWAYPDGFINVCALELDSRDVRYIVISGKHRAAVLSHLGYQSVWVRFLPSRSSYPGKMPNRIKLSDIDNWERVDSGAFTREDAGKFFESYFSYDGKEQARSLGLSNE